MAKRKSDYTEILIRQGVISPEQLAEAQQVVAQSGTSLSEALTQLGYATGEEVMRAMAEQHGLDYVNLAEVSIPPSVVELVPESVARENVAIPLSESDGKLTVIVSDPMDYDTFDKLRFILNRQIEIALAPREAILEAINRHYGQTVGESADSMLQEFTDTAIDFTETMQESEAGEEEVDESSAPVVRLVQLVITEAVQLRASDIHIEPFEDRIRVRYRIDGMLVERDSPPKRLLGAILSRIKILSKLDIAERRRTQDGRIKVSVGEKELDLRVSVIPTSHGQSVVMRILDKDSIKVGLRQLGFSEEDYHRVRGLIQRPNGIILVTGPTGSGKTTSLYAALNELNTPDRKIITAEDPVEYYLPGVNQVEIRHEIGLDFARVIRAMLRQAPNVILVGEMRDLETAQMGIQAIFDWTPGFQYATYERCAQCHYTSDRHGCPRLSRLQQRRGHHGAAVGPRRLPEMQASVYPTRGIVRGRRHHPRNGGQRQFRQGERLWKLPRERVPRAVGYLRVDADVAKNPRIDVQRRAHGTYPAGGDRRGNENTVLGRHRQGAPGRHNPGGSPETAKRSEPSKFYSELSPRTELRNEIVGRLAAGYE